MTKFGMQPKRLPIKDFKKLKSLVLNSLAETFGDTSRFCVPKWREDKTDFGDLDVLCGVGKEEVEKLIRLVTILSGHKPHINGHTISVPIDGFQCDFILVAKDEYDVAYRYFSYEAGNFMGVIAKRMGLKYGHDGLFIKLPISYFVKQKVDVSETIPVLLTRNPVVIFNVLGFDLIKFISGFANHNEFGEWICNSKFFDPSFFQYENLNHINRTRNKKRPLFKWFVDYCKDKPRKDEPTSFNKLIKIAEHTPSIYERILAIKSEMEAQYALKSKYNGKLVSEWTGLSGIELGVFMATIKAANPKWDSVIRSTPNENIKEIVQTIYGIYSR